jgi:CRISPR-associated protein Cas5/DevS
MLLSLLGIAREDKARHRGAEMAVAVANVQERLHRSRVFRKLRRGKDLEDTRPDYQDLLLDLKLWVWLRRGTDQANPPLCDSIPAVLRDPRTIKRRSGGLSLGESSYLVDVICIDPEPQEPLVFLIPDEERGFYSMPVWVDHLDRKNTFPGRFRLSDPVFVSEGLKDAWICIGGKS